MLAIMAGMNQKCFFKFVDNPGSGMCRAGIAGYNAPRAVFSSLVGRPRMLVILAGIDQEVSCSGMFKADFAGYYTPRAVFSSLVRWSMMLGIMAVMNQKDSFSRLYNAGIAGGYAPRAVFPSLLSCP